MSLFVLDTDVLTLYYHGDIFVVRAVNARLPSDLAISVITVDELVVHSVTEGQNRQEGGQRGQ